jgi:hypothetical protein
MARLDELRPLRVVIQHAAQFLNTRRQRVVGHRDVTPHGRKQVGLRHGRARVRDEQLQDLRGLGRQAHFLAAEPQLARVGVEAVLAEADARGHEGNDQHNGVPPGFGLRASGFR